MIQTYGKKNCIQRQIHTFDTSVGRRGKTVTAIDSCFAILIAAFAQEKRLMNCRLSSVSLVATIFALATASVATANSADESAVISHGYKYCWYDSAWTGAGWTPPVSEHRK
jgi:hypothetical protein